MTTLEQQIIDAVSPIIGQVGFKNLNDKNYDRLKDLLNKAREDKMALCENLSEEQMLSA